MFVAAFTIAALWVPRDALALQAGAAPRTAPSWQARSSTLEERTTLSVVRPGTGARWSFALAARRRIRDGGWDWAEAGVSRPIGSGRWTSIPRVQSSLRYQPARGDVRLILGLEPSRRITDRLALSAGYRWHFARMDGSGVSVIARGMRAGATVRLAGRSALSAALGYGERPGGVRLDIAFRRGS